MKQKFTYSFLLMIFAISLFAQNTYHVAGGSSNGYKIENGFGLFPKITFDKSGDMYTSLSANDVVEVIRKYDFKRNIILTIAGYDRGIGNFQEGARATQSPLLNYEHVLQTLAVDNQENIFYLTNSYSDKSPDRIIKVSYGGFISTYAGTDSNGYSGDNGPVKLAQLNKPTDIAFDKNGNMLIADSRNNRIRKIDKNGIITTIAGTGVAGYSGDGYAATLAELNLPFRLAIDKYDNIYFSDTNNKCIRKIDAQGIISTYINNQQYLQAFSFPFSPNRLTTDTSGNLIVCNYGSELGRFSTNGTFKRIVPKFSFNDRITGLAINNKNEIFTSDAYTIYKITNDNIIDTFSGNNRGSTYSDDEYFAEAYSGYSSQIFSYNNTLHELYVTGSQAKICLADSVSGKLKLKAGGLVVGYSGDGGKAIDAEIRVTGFCVDNKRNIYMTDATRNKVRKIDTAGIITRFAGTSEGYGGDGGPATSARLHAPKGIATDSKGNIYVADTYNNRIRKINAATNIITTYAGNGTPGFSGDGGVATDAGLAGPTKIAFDDNDVIYISDTENKRIRKVDKNGIITTIAGNGKGYVDIDSVAAKSTGIGRPQAICVTNQSVYFVSSNRNNYIYKINLATGLLTKVEDIRSYTYDLSVDSKGSIYYASFGNLNRLNFDCSENQIADSSALEHLYINKPEILHDDCRLIASIIPLGNRNEALNSIVKAQVFVNKSVIKKNNATLAERYYRFMPQLNVRTAKSNLTLFFKQAEFTDYNNHKNNNASALPANQLDIAAKKNIRIVQTFDSSLSGYKIISPDDNNITWNDSLSCWQLMFNATGLGSFYLTSKLNNAEQSNAISENLNAGKVIITPNPTSDVVTVSVTNTLLNSKFELLSAEGKILLQQVLSSANTQFDLRNYASGIYFARFADGSVYKIVKQ